MATIRPALQKIDAERSTATEIVVDIDVPEPLVRNETVTLRFSLTPTTAGVEAGERLRLDIGVARTSRASYLSQGQAEFQGKVPPYFSRNSAALRSGKLHPIAEGARCAPSMMMKPS
jgi:hypothetical protein